MSYQLMGRYDWSAKRAGREVGGEVAMPITLGLISVVQDFDLYPKAVTSYYIFLVKGRF